MKNKYCHNCHYPHKTDQRYCSNCGQKNIKGKVRLSEFLRGFFSSIFNWDAKIWITPIMLFRPGFLSSEFFKGRRARYTHPGKLLLFLLVIYSAFFMYYASSGFDRLDEGNDYAKYEHTIQYLEQKKDTLHIYLDEVYPNAKLNGIVDSIERFIAPGDGTIQIGLSDRISISYRDLATLSDDEFLEKYKVEVYWKKILMKRARKIAVQPGGYLKYLMSRISWVVLASIPFLAIVLMLLYIRQKKYYVEHVVFLVHVNSFMFLLGVLFFIIGYFFDVIPIISLLPFVLGVIYIYFAMKLFYGQSYLKTFIKYTLLFWSSISIFMSLGFAVFGIGLLLY
ncbi:MAG: hypothetical protein ACI94Y_000869 [Maribacter sp.]|jgi:hypothetical protein